MKSTILKPIITEKSMRLAAQNVYMFDVENFANKILVKQAVKDQFKVDSTQVRVSVLKGKSKRFKGVIAKRSDSKRAYVTVKKGQKISVFEIQEETK